MKPETKYVASYYVYILECSDKTYYTGYTNDLEKRLKSHNAGLASKCTRARLPVKVVWTKEYKRSKYAMRTEYRIKQLKRFQKELLVGGMRLNKVLALHT